MEFKATIRCLACGYHQKTTIVLPYNCDDYICKKCATCNSLSILSIDETSVLNAASVSITNENN